MVISSWPGPADRRRTGGQCIVVPGEPLDAEVSCHNVPQSEGMIGYMLEQELATVLADRPVAALLTQIVVDPEDPAFARPTKPIGPLYDRDAAAALSASRGWFMGPDAGGFRRLVPSPEPLRILELTAISILVESGVIVVCAGVGGVPVVIDEAVIGPLHEAARMAVGEAGTVVRRGAAGVRFRESADAGPR